MGVQERCETVTRLQAALREAGQRIGVVPDWLRELCGAAQEQCDREARLKKAVQEVRRLGVKFPGSMVAGELLAAAAELCGVELKPLYRVHCGTAYTEHESRAEADAALWSRVLSWWANSLVVRGLLIALADAKGRPAAIDAVNVALGEKRFCIEEVTV